MQIAKNQFTLTMQAYASYQITLSSSEANIATATSILAEVFENESLKGQTTIEIQESYKVVWVEHIISIAKRIVREAPTLTNLVIDGYTDCEDDGTTMDFLIKYEQRHLTVQRSEWYYELGACMDYDEFCEDFCDEDGVPLYSEEKFEEIINSDYPCFVVIGDENRVIVDEVPLGELKEVDPNSVGPVWDSLGGGDLMKLWQYAVYQRYMGQ